MKIKQTNKQGHLLKSYCQIRYATNEIFVYWKNGSGEEVRPREASDEEVTVSPHRSLLESLECRVDIVNYEGQPVNKV